MPRQSKEERRRADRAARRLRAEDEWTERHKEVFPEHDTLSGKRRLPPGVLARGENVEEASIEGKHINGRLGKDSIPGDIQYGKVKVRAGGADDVDWGDRSVPKRALPTLVASDVGAATTQSVASLRKQVRQLKWEIKQLQPRRR